MRGSDAIEALDGCQLRVSLVTGLRAAATGLFCLVITLVMGRDVVSHIGAIVLHDAGDPVFTAALLEWNAMHLPYSEAWWQLPIYFPVRDTLAFSEHLLGISILAAPIRWLTGDAIVTYNVVALATFPLCAVAMHALVRYLTGSDAGGFVAGAAFAFSPYRMSQLTHVQMLATFWAPLALLGLHAFLATGKRRWLALYGIAWMLQAAANLYALAYFSVLVGLWIVWFVVRARRWRAWRDCHGHRCRGVTACANPLPLYRGAPAPRLLAQRRGGAHVQRRRRGVALREPGVDVVGFAADRVSSRSRALSRRGAAGHLPRRHRTGNRRLAQG